MGAATCRLLVERGWEVIASDSRPDGLDVLVEDLGPRLKPVVADLADPAAVEALGATPDTRLDALVNLAGVSCGAPVSEMVDKDWQVSLDINVTAPMRLIRAALPGMRERGGGCIVNVASPVALIGARKASYAASKAALHGLTMATAREGGPHGVRACTLLPGPTITGMTADWPEAKRQAIAQSTFLKRLCTPPEVAAVIAFLLAPEASYLTGCLVDLTAGSMHGH